jgi:3',5'-cyclic AMP phosphodiesterase CpdA
LRIAHLTDLHVQRAPRASELFSKRLLGAVNLYVLGRRGHFSQDVQAGLVASVRAVAPDVIACTGDLTALATAAEFDAARALLGPLFGAHPTVLVPGNHDTYTRGSWRAQALAAHFAPWVGEGPWPRVRAIGGVAFIALDVCRAHPLSSGRCPEAQLARLDALLGGGDLPGGAALVLLHYPLRDRHGRPYGPFTRNLSNAAALEAVLLRHRARVTAVLHGHEHHGYRTNLGGIPLLNPGAGGYADLRARGRRAHWCLYTVERGALTAVERFAWDGARFAPEPGGPWSSGG